MNVCFFFDIIIDNLFPIDAMDFKEFLNYRLVNKTWNNIISDEIFITLCKLSLSELWKEYAILKGNKQVN